MRILVDLQGAQNNSRHRGIGRYSMALAKAIARNAGQHQVFILLNGLFADTIEDIKKDFAGILPDSHFLLFVAPGPVDELRSENEWRRQTGELLREHVIDSLAPDVLLITSLVEGAEDDTIASIGRLTTSVAVAAVLYDLIPLTDPDQYIGWAPARKWYLGKIDSMRRADFLFAISNAAAEEAIRMLHVEADRIANISSAADASFSSIRISSSQIAEVSQRFGINRKYLMHSSAFEPRKNFQGLIKAFAALPKTIRKDYQLVLVCKLHGAGRSELEELARVSGLDDGELVLTGYVPDSDLIALYSGCHLFVFPSFHEGFGLPALEAMSCGAPAIGSNVTSIPEVIGRDDALFDPASTESMASLIRRVLTEPAFHRSLTEHAVVQARKFSWDETALRVIRGLENLHDRRGKLPSSDSFKPDLTTAIDMMAQVANVTRPTDAEIFELARCIAANENAVAKLKASADFSGALTWRLEGPFDSTYSLALLNRETARALSALGHTVVLHSTEGPGDFPANPAFLQQNPDLAAMHARVPDYSHQAVDAVSRNLYPPRVEDMGSALNMLHHYAWEESAFPQAWAANFNAHLNGLTCLSTHVEKIMLDNGVQVPMTTSGCGVDHWERITPQANYKAPGRSFRFLHVSSCFPRKGIDALLDAFGKAFTSADDVSLVVKTFPNPHNEIHSLIAHRRSQAPAYPDVIVIEQDLSDSDLKALYQSCHALVAPSRAEGFGLPLAEAMLSGLPVITTAWSGQLDFCNDQTAWLVDYSFRRTETHFGLFASVWAEPDVDALARTLAHVRSLPPAQLRARAQAGRTLLLENFKWSDVAARLVTAAQSQRSAAQGNSTARIGWITTWNTKCGIASYSEHLIERFPEEVMVLAPHQDGRLREDSANCVRCWLSSKDENDFDALTGQIGRHNLDTLIVQFNYGFFNFRQLSQFISAQIDDGRTVIVMMHSTGDPGLLPAWNWTLDELLPALSRCDRVLVHSLNDLNRLKRLGLVDNVALFPLGILSVEPKSNARKGDVPLIATYGYCLPHKGLIEIVQAVDLLRRAGTPVRLRLVNAEYPAPVSSELVKQIRTLVSELALGDMVEMHHDYLEDDQSLHLLHGADLIVYAYQQTNESASAAVRYGLATHRPVAVTPLPIFDDLGGAVHRLSGGTPEQIAQGIASTLQEIARESDAARTVAIEAQRWRLAHSYVTLSRRLCNICVALSKAKKPWRHVFNGSSPQLRTLVGEIHGRSLVSTGAHGYLMFGPHLRLAAGQYEVSVTGKYRIPEGEDAYLDVAVDHGKVVLARMDFRGTADGTLATLVFQLEERCHDLEVRVVVGKHVEYRVERIEIQPWNKRAAINHVMERSEHQLELVG